MGYCGKNAGVQSPHPLLVFSMSGMTVIAVWFNKILATIDKNQEDFLVKGSLSPSALCTLCPVY